MKALSISGGFGGLGRSTRCSFVPSLLVLHSALSAFAAVPTYERQIFFENATPGDAYFHSSASVVGPSELEVARDKFPTTTARFVSPPNSLRLAWKSAPGGEWRMTLERPQRIGADLPLQGDTLCMWCFAEDEIAEGDSPLVGVQDSRGNGLPEVPLLAGVGRLPANKWVRLELSLGKFTGLYSGTDEPRFDPRKLARITFTQYLDDGRKHAIYFDDIRVIDSGRRDKQAPAAPTKVTAEGLDRHIDLAWHPVEDSDVCSYRIYRSENGGSYSPINTRPGYFTRFVDFVGAPGKSYLYKVAAVDFDNNESELSESAGGTTREFNDNELLDMVQRGCFRYYWEAANPQSGMGLEVLPGDNNLVCLGGSGFGIIALVVATEREFVSRGESVERMLRIVRFLARADRFHGVWPHYLDGSTGRAWPLFGKYDNGGDLVETAFLIQGLLAARQYFDDDTPQEREIRETITRLWQEVEWDWYRKTPNGEVLYWHWSPDHDWHISHPLVGWNETLIVYLLAIASPTHPVPASLYYTGWAGQSDLAVDYRHGWSRTTHGDHYRNGNTYYGHKLDVGCGTGGDLFFTQFSFLGFDPRGRKDKFTNYFHNNRQLALINRAYCIVNPRGFVGYGPDCWGLSAGIRNGGGKPQPRSDNGTLCSSAALGCFPYAPQESMAVLRHLYRDLGDRVWGVYGFHDGFNETESWFDECYMGLNQAQIVVGIENHRSGLPWKLFMANPEIQPMLDAIGFVPDKEALVD